MLLQNEAGALARVANVLSSRGYNIESLNVAPTVDETVSLLTLGIIYGYFTDPRSWVRVAITLATIPIAIIANGLRVAGTGVAAHYYGEEAATGFFHTFSGWLVFAVAFGMLFVVMQLLQKIRPARRTPAPAAPLAPARGGVTL